MRLIQTGDFVDPTFTNRPHQDIDANVDEVIRYINDSPLANFEYDPTLSPGLNFRVQGGVIRNQTGVAIKSAATLTLVANTTNYVQVDPNGAINRAAGSFTAGHIPLFEVTTNATVPTSILDRRTLFISELGTNYTPTDASQSAKGVIEIATNGEAQVGTDAVRAITPASLTYVLNARLTDATDTAKGIVELATGAETITGTDATRAITPAALKAWGDTFLPTAGGTVADATISVKGIVQLSNSVTSTSEALAATPKAVKAAYDLANHSHPYAATSHSHSAADITSGTMAIARLPVGTGAGQVAAGDHNHNAAYAAAGHTHDWTVITGKPATFPPDAHTHDWSSITGKPTTFTPSTHTHDQLHYVAAMRVQATSAGATVSGVLTASDVTITSDQRVKTNIVPLFGSVERVKKINVYSYLKEGAYSEGVLAQEIQGQFPHLVVADEEGKLSVNYMGFIAMLIGAVREIDNKFNTGMYC